MNKVYIVEAVRDYGDWWIEEIFDSREKAEYYALNREIRKDPIEDHDLMLNVREREVK